MELPLRLSAPSVVRVVVTSVAEGPTTESPWANEGSENVVMTSKAIANIRIFMLFSSFFCDFVGKGTNKRAKSQESRFFFL
jgi:hypothetical protein